MSLTPHFGKHFGSSAGSFDRQVREEVDRAKLTGTSVYKRLYYHALERETIGENIDIM